MTLQTLFNHGPLALLLLAVVLFSAWTFMHSHRSYLLRWLLIPLVAGAAWVSATLYDARLGYAAAIELPEKFVYLAHHVVTVNGDKVALEIWGQQKQTRLYRVPYSKLMEKALQQAHAAGKKGNPVVMQKRKQGEGKEGKPGGIESEVDQEPYQSNIVLPDEAMPKSAPDSSTANPSN